MPAADRTRNFFSCGGNKQPQFQDLDESTISAKLREGLDKLGYDVYFALPEQSTEGVKDIFENLRISEYYLFIDFKREKLIGPDGSEIAHRGSLFTNQEMAVAKFLKMKIIAFQESAMKTEDAVKKEDGILKFIHVNPIPFTTREGLLDNILGKVKADWTTGWRIS